MTAINQRGWPGGRAGRLTIEERIARQRAKIETLNERIGYLCTQRVDAEDVLAEMLEYQLKMLDEGGHSR